ncbi:MAG: DMT family transporter [Novosphingobium sp.]|jgi:drug/metabolite transporter (DMT)-like permease|uniref:DMT family transporter n=1 Tax=Novosphingobium sp. TaxID=1874826 RepID=UPI0022BBA663|nr:DMT family transporter [Novosphingobium sp.]MCZ8036176.1 DMT family transporter [Novosphingobium sp.]
MSQGTDKLTLLFLIALIAIWGGNYTWVKVALQDIGPWTFNAVRYGGATLLMLGVFALKGPLSAILPVKEERWPLALIGLLQAGFTTAFAALALQWIEATRVVLINYSMPIWTLPLSLLLLGERISLRAGLGAALGAAGLVLLTNPFAMTWNELTLPGVLWAFASVLSWAFGAVLYRRQKWTSGFWQQSFWQIAVTFLFMTPFALALETGRSVNPTPSLLLVIAYNMIVPTVVGFWCWSQALSRVSATTASQFLLLSPVFGMVQNHFVLGEPLGAWIGAAAACIILGAFVSLRSAPATRSART